MSRYLVTGATGFLGSHLAAQLAAAGDEVVAVARSLPALPAVPKASTPSAQGVEFEWRAVDVRDEAALEAAARGASGVFHCAGFVSRDPKDSQRLHEVHVEGTRAVLRAAERAGVKRVVVASTSGTIGISETPEIATEETPAPLALIDRFPYYRAKLYAERAAFEVDPAKLEVVVVNPSLLLGPGDVRGSSTEDVRSFLERKIPVVPPGGLSFVDARDAAEAMALAMERGRPRERYLVGAENLSLRDFFDKLSRVSNVPAPVVTAPLALRKLASFFGDGIARAASKLGAELDATSLALSFLYFYIDSSKAERELGWKPRPTAATLADTVSDLRARGVVWPEAGVR